MNDPKRLTVKCSGCKIDTIVTRSSKVVEDWIQQVYSENSNEPQVIVGLDIEWRPTFQKKSYHKVALIQICVKEKCIIIQLFYIDKLPELLRTFFLDQKFLFSGNCIKGDVRRLKIDYGLEFNDNVYDVAPELRAKRPNRYSSYTLENLARAVGGLRDFKKDKKVCMGNWERDDLHLQQIEYASRDAFASYRVAEKVVAMTVEKEPKDQNEKDFKESNNNNGTSPPITRNNPRKSKRITGLTVTNGVN